MEADFLGLAGPDRIIVIVSTDTLFGAQMLEMAVADALRPVAGNRDIAVVSAATHTHYAPALDSDKPALGAPDPHWQRETMSRIADAVALALQDAHTAPAPALHWQQAQAQIPLSVSRRRCWRWPVLSRRTLLRFPGIVMAPAPDEPIDRTARLASIVDGGGRPLALLLHWAAHPTVYPDRDLASPDYIGVVRDRLRSAFGDAGLPILFLQGFAGDIRPAIAGSWHQPLIDKIKRGPGFAPVTVAAWQTFAEDVASHFTAMAAAAAGSAHQPLVQPMPLALADAPLADMIDGDARQRRLTLRRVDCTPGPSLLFVNAEPSSAHCATVAAQLGDAWPVGYAGDVFGYWPTSAQVREGGYEGGGFFGYFGLSGRFNGSNDAQFAAMLNQLSR